MSRESFVPLILPANPTNPMEAATKAYVDGPASPTVREYLLQNYSFAAASSYTFSIPATVRSIRLHMVGRFATGGGAAVGLRFNGDTAANYYWTSMRSKYGDAAPSIYNELGNRICLGIWGGSADRNGEIHATIPYVQSVGVHGVLAQGGHLSGSIASTHNYNQGSWEVAAAITSMTVMNDGSYFFVGGYMEVWATGT